MKRKTAALALVLALAVTAGAFATGQREDRTGPDGPWANRGPEISKEKITVTGPVTFEDLHHPQIESDGKEYELLFPRRYLGDVDVKEGQTVTVEGYAVTGMFCEGDEEDDEVHLMVTMAKIGDREYDLEADRWGWGPGGRGGPMGHHGPMMWDRGPGSRWNRGPMMRGRAPR